MSDVEQLKQTYQNTRAPHELQARLLADFDTHAHDRETWPAPAAACAVLLLVASVFWLAQVQTPGDVETPPADQYVQLSPGAAGLPGLTARTSRFSQLSLSALDTPKAAQIGSLPAMPGMPPRPQI